MNTRWLALVGAVVILMATGLWLFRDHGDATPGTSSKVVAGVVQDDSGRRVLYWYDPMAPQQRFDKPGKSPFMDMQLVPKYADEADDTGVRVSPSVQQSLGIRTAPVERAPFGESLAAVARLEVNERHLYALPSRVSGYVERLHVRAVGDPVAAGQKVAEIYSPELLSAQQEFLALRRAGDLTAGTDLVGAVRERLRLLGMAVREIDALERSGQATSRFGVYAPVNGYVVELATREGGTIESGATLLSIADLSSLWLIAELPERDSSRARPGDVVEAQLEGVGGEVVSGHVDFIYPSLNEETRTARARIVVPNPRNVLRPGMFARVRISSADREALSVPSEAVISTGTRSIVIVRDDYGFRPAEVRTGAELGERTEILSGLREGEQVVASGQFLLDSEASLNSALARLSQQEAGHEHAAHAQIEAVEKESEQ
ncbi:MAG TPA: efflux RND transporter periplasmic adaptor subunit [Steroidobacter sp.]|uniref:efflux RND transporter periplasmic adaptor subunit n=1 Tax=Steroidobacter sp. TaxID=1978227 RepID=UPI002EDA1634